MVGCLEPGRFFFDVELDVDEEEEYVDRLTLVFGLDGLEVAPGAEVELPALLILDGRDPQALD